MNRYYFLIWYSDTTGRASVIKNQDPHPELPGQPPGVQIKTLHEARAALAVWEMLLKGRPGRLCLRDTIGIDGMEVCT